MNKLVMLILLPLLISCSKDTEKENNVVMENTGTVWKSGGLYYCATQFRMDTGDTLVPTQALTPAIVALRSGDRIHLKYSIPDERESGCTIGKDCRVIEISKIE
jgi:hypothetical protein